MVSLFFLYFSLCKGIIPATSLCLFSKLMFILGGRMFGARILALAIAGLLFFAPAADAAAISMCSSNFLYKECVIDNSITSATLASKDIVGGSLASYNYLISGQLNPWTSISLTFNATGLTNGALLSNGNVGADLPTSLLSAWPVLTTSSMTLPPADSLTNTVNISNLTGSAVSFGAYFISLVKALKSGGSFVLSYTIHSVPLPPAALLFASALMLFAGMAMRKNAKSV